MGAEGPSAWNHELYMMLWYPLVGLCVAYNNIVRQVHKWYVNDSSHLYTSILSLVKQATRVKTVNIQIMVCKINLDKTVGLTL